MLPGCRASALVLLLAMTVGAGAATPAVPATLLPGPRLTLSQAYRIALTNDATLRAARAAADAGRERVPQARAQLLPNISASAGRFRNDLEATVPAADGEQTSSDRYMSHSRLLSVRQPLFRPAGWAELRQARAEVAQAEAVFERELQLLAVRVTLAYLQALAAQDQLELVRTQQRAIQTQLDAARRRFEGGAGTRTDVDEARARLDLSTARELESRQHVDYTRRQLQVLLDTPFGALAPLDPARLSLTAPDAPLEEWTREAEAASPEIRALRARVDAARAQVDRAQAAHLPTLDAVAQWSVSDSDQVTRLRSRYDQKSIGLQFNLPLYAGGQASSLVRQALAEQARAEELLEAARRELGLRVHKEFRGVSEGVLRVRALEQAVLSGRTAVESARRSFQAGSRTVVDVLNAEEQLAVAQRDLAEARYGYLLARVQLRALAGTADHEAIEEVDRALSQ